VDRLFLDANILFSAAQATHLLTGDGTHDSLAFTWTIGNASCNIYQQSERESPKGKRARVSWQSHLSRC
jgi:hypothetical protein